MPELPSALAVVALGAGTALAWGSADFTGGLASRRAPLFGVLLFGQATGMILAALVWAGRGEPMPQGPDLAWSILAGCIGALAVGCLYRGFQVGRIGVVAPVSGALGATIPVVVGSATEGIPEPMAIAGIALAIVSIVLVSFVADDRSRGPSGLGWAIAAAVWMGTFNVVINEISVGLVASPLTILRVVEVLLYGLAVLVTARRWRVPRTAWGLTLAAGAFDVTGNLAFIGAVQVGALAIASVLSSLYPVVTILLAVAILRERITLVQGIGIAASVVAIALISAGTAGAA
jgi:drug/metabolite transporter (DMT)-like permease